MGFGICVHEAYVMNTSSTILSEVIDQKVTLPFRGIQRQIVVWDSYACGPGRLFLRPLHGATCKDEGVFAHVRGGEYFSGQICDPVTELVMTLCDKDAPLTIEGTADRKVGFAAVTVMGEVWGIYAISQEEGILPFLRTNFFPVYHGRMNRHPGPCICCTSQPTCALEWVP